MREHFPKYGPSWSGWRKLLPGRTTPAICSRRKTLGVPGVRASGNYRPKDISASPRRPKFKSADKPQSAAPRRGPLRVCVPSQAGDWSDEQIGWLVDAMGLMGDTGHTLGECVTMIGAIADAYEETLA